MNFKGRTVLGLVIAAIAITTLVVRPREKAVLLKESIDKEPISDRIETVEEQNNNSNSNTQHNMVETKRDWRGQIIGKFYDLGETIKVQDARGQWRGTYVKRGDYTQDARGAKVGSGNLLLMLLD